MLTVILFVIGLDSLGMNEWIPWKIIVPTEVIICSCINQNQTVVKVSHLRLAPEPHVKKKPWHPRLALELHVEKKPWHPRPALVPHVEKKPWHPRLALAPHMEKNQWCPRLTPQPHMVKEPWCNMFHQCRQHGWTGGSHSLSVSMAQCVWTLKG